MEPDPNPYTPPASPLPAPVRRTTRQAVKRRVQAAWLVTLGALVFALLHAGDRDPLQMAATLLCGFCAIVSALSTVVYWVGIVPFSR